MRHIYYPRSLYITTDNQPAPQPADRLSSFRNREPHRAAYASRTGLITEQVVKRINPGV